MKPRCKHRFVLFLCILVLGEEFAKAKTLKEPFDDQDHKNRKIFDDETDDEDNSFHDDDDDDDDNDIDGSTSAIAEDEDSKTKRVYVVSQRPVDKCGGERGWITSIFKAVKIGSKIAGYASAIISLGANIYLAVNGCAGPYPDAKIYHDKFLEKRKEAERLGNEAEELQLGAEMDQNYVESTAEIFGKILCKLNEIDTESDTMLQAISADVKTASKNASLAILDLIEEKNKTLNKIKYLEVDGLYRTALHNALAISFPALSIAIPAAWEMFKYARERYRQRRVGVMQTENNVDFELPPKTNTNLFKETRFGKWIGTQQVKFKDKLIRLKRKFNLSFTKIAKVAKAFKGGLATAGRFAFAAYQAYESIKGLTDCKIVRDNAKEAYDKAVDATNKISDTLTTIKEHRKSMDLMWSSMRRNITEDMFLESVGTAKKVMENSANNNEPMQAIARGIGNFLDRIKTTDDHRITHDLSVDLYNVLIKVPFAFICYTNKVDMVKNVIGDCKEGAYSMGDLLQQQRDRVDESLDEPDSPRACKDDRGIDYVTDEQIRGAWYKAAELEGYHRVCYMNDPTKRDNFCEKYREEDMSAEEISSYYKNKYKAADIDEVLQLLPKGKLLPTFKRRTICTLRDRDFTDERIQGLPLFGDLSLDDVKSVKCPLENCVPNDLLPQRERSTEEDDD